MTRYVQNSAQTCLNGFQTDDERNDVLNDICDTLVNLMDLYRECLTNFSVEDLLDVCRLPVPRPSAQKIAELFGQVSQERIKIGVGINGEGVFKFPVSASLLSSDKKNGDQFDALWIKIVHSTDITWITYNREGDNWQIDYTGGAPVENGYVEIPLIDVKEITRIPVHNGEQCHTGAMDIRPRVCDNRYVLFVEHAGNASIYLPGRKVNKNDVCHVFPTSSIDRLRVVIKDEDGNERDIKSNDVGRIVLEGDNLDALIVDDDVYPITCGAEQDWLDKEKRFRYLYRAGSGAYQADVCPVKVDKFPAAREIIYRVDDDEIVLREKDGLQWNPWVIVPPKFLWKRGKIVVRGDSEELANTKVIFVNVDFGDFDMPSQVDEELDPATIRYQGGKGDWVSPTLNYKHGDSLIQFEVENLTIKRSIDRVGVFFITPSGVSISIPPESKDWRKPTRFAKDDIYNLTCKVVVPFEGNAEYKVLLIKGREYIELKRVAQEKIREKGCTTFHWRDYVAKFSELNKDSDYFSICIRSTSDEDIWMYKFRAIDPVKLRYAAVGALSPHTVRHKFEENGTLKICHYIAFSDIPDTNEGIATSFVCCPITKLDDKSGFIELPCQSNFTTQVHNDLKVAQEVVVVPNFKTAIGDQLDSGCVCFLAKKQKFINAGEFQYRLVSSGFFVRETSAEPKTNSLDIISKLRHALAIKDEETLLDLFQSEKEDVRGVVKGVLDRVWENVVNIHAPEVRDYLNLYRCVIKNVQGESVERSGYAFLADWYDFGQNSPCTHGVDRHLADEYKKYWPRLMFPIQKVGIQHPATYLEQYLQGNTFKLQCRMLSSPTLALSTFLELYDVINAKFSFESTHEHGHPNTWICSKSIGKCFFGQYSEYCCDKNVKLNWSQHIARIQATPSLARQIMRKKPYIFYAGLPLMDQLRCTPDNILCGLRKREIREFLRCLAVELCEWRKRPCFDERAQKLKRNLLLLERIDSALFSAPQDGDKPSSDAPCCFTELVELLAFNQFIHSN